MHPSVGRDTAAEQIKQTPAKKTLLAHLLQMNLYPSLSLSLSCVCLYWENKNLMRRGGFFFLVEEVENEPRNMHMNRSKKTPNRKSSHCARVEFFLLRNEMSPAVRRMDRKGEKSKRRMLEANQRNGGRLFKKSQIIPHEIFIFSN